MARTLICGEENEEVFIAKVTDWMHRELTNDERSTTVRLRNQGCAFSYVVYNLKMQGQLPQDSSSTKEK